MQPFHVEIHQVDLVEVQPLVKEYSEEQLIELIREGKYHWEMEYDEHTGFVLDGDQKIAKLQWRDERMDVIGARPPSLPVETVEML
ncbi:MAG: hypothetical protein ACK4RK_03420 [Gemmataceae bacterium]